MVWAERRWERPVNSAVGEGRHLAAPPLLQLDRAGADVVVDYVVRREAAGLTDYVAGTTIYIDDGMTFFPGFAEGG